MADERESDEWMFGAMESEDTPVPLPWWEHLRDELGLASVLRLNKPERPLPLIGRFEGIRYRSRGGFGVVFMARDPELDRHVALKFCMVPSEQTRETLLHEAKLLAQLSHPNTVTVHETGWYGPNLFFAMEYVEGTTAHEFIFRLPSPSWAEIVAVYAGAGAGLAEAHRKGIVHGDFKPGNVLLGHDDWPRVADFGLAHREASGEVDRVGGTIAFAAPEVLVGIQPDARSDQWSFCVSLWQTLEFGELPFAGETHEEVIRSIMAGLPEHSPGVPAGLREITRRGLALEPCERYPDMQALLDDLRRVALEEEEQRDEETEDDASRSGSALVPVSTPQASRLSPPSLSARHLLGACALSSAVTALLAIALLVPGRGVAPAQNEGAPSVAEAVRPQPSSQCHSRDTAIDSISSELESVCVKIRAGKLESATDDWIAFREREYPKEGGAGYDVAVMQIAAQTKVVADTFDDQASKFSDAGRVKQARDRARFMVFRYLGDYQKLEPEPPQP